LVPPTGFLSIKGRDATPFSPCTAVSSACSMTQSSNSDVVRCGKMRRKRRLGSRKVLARNMRRTCSSGRSSGRSGDGHSHGNIDVSSQKWTVSRAVRLLKKMVATMQDELDDMHSRMDTVREVLSMEAFVKCDLDQS
jgi:hypothetical protein